MTIAQDRDGSVQVASHFTLTTTGSRWTTRYTMYSGGVLTLEYDFVPGSSLLPEIPRLGVSLTLPEAFDRVSWYGRGPWENYWDRKTGAPVGRYEAAVEDLY